MNKPRFYLSMGTAAIILSAFLMMASCNRKKTDPAPSSTSEDTGYATDHATTEQAFDDVQNIADKASQVTSGGSLNFKMSSCASVVHAGDSIVVDFGPTNCLCADGRYRRGKIIVHYTGAYADSGSTHTITFNNYYQNDNQITGTKTVTNMGHNGAGHPYFNITVSGSIIRSSGATISASWTRVREWTNGYTTLGDWSDDTYSITGSGTITRAGGTVNVSITSPLIVALSCHWIEAGSVTYTLPSGLTRVLNYGATATCDNNATVTLPSGTTIAITLP